MIIRHAYVVGTDNRTEFAWANLRRFHNVDYVEKILCELHALPMAQRQNAKKQAAQIRYCLVQAREYFDAAERASLATKPTLAYYSIMTLALAEILFKQSGESSLDRARDHHRHHGLTLSISSQPKAEMGIRDAAERLRALPLTANNSRRGTFELWHRSAREMPIVGHMTQFEPNGPSFTRFDVALGVSDYPLPKLPERGISLFDCLDRLPCMLEFFSISGLPTNIIRGRVTTEHRAGNRTFNVFLHPSTPATFAEFCDNARFHPDSYDRITFQESGAAGHLRWTTNDDHVVRLNIPSGAMLKCDEVHFWTKNQPLNEFGFFYVALYILGNYARYYPDKWMVDVDRGSPLALATEHLMHGFVSRGPLLSLSELSRTYFVAPS